MSIIRLQYIISFMPNYELTLTISNGGLERWLQTNVLFIGIIMELQEGMSVPEPKWLVLSEGPIPCCRERPWRWAPPCGSARLPLGLTAGVDVAAGAWLTAMGAWERQDALRVTRDDRPHGGEIKGGGRAGGRTCRSGGRTCRAGQGRGAYLQVRTRPAQVLDLALDVDQTLSLVVELP